MTCLIYERRIGLYAGDNLDEPDTRVVEAHLATCAACRSLLLELRQQQVSLAAWGEQVPSQEDLDAVREQVLSAVMRGAVPEAPRRWGQAVRWTRGAIPVAAAAVLLLVVWQSMKRPDVEPSRDRAAAARPDSVPARPTAAAPTGRASASAALPKRRKNRPSPRLRALRSGPH